MLSHMVFRQKTPIKPRQILVRCRHCNKLFSKPVAQDHIARCREQQEQQRKAQAWWNNERD